MSLGPVRIPQLQQANPIVDDQGRMTNEFARRLNDIFQSLAYALNQVTQLPDIQAAILAAQTAASNAQAAADSAQAAGAVTSRETAINNSYISPASALTASPTLITVAAHTRIYGDGTSVSVNGGSVTATASGDTDYVSYVQSSRAGGAVTYVAGTVAPAQTGDTHVIGAVVIPATGTATGGRGPLQPGYVEP